MKKVVIMEIWVDETLEDANECVKEILDYTESHYLISDGSIKIETYETC